MSLAALELTLQIYLEGRASELPVWKALEKTPDSCKSDAEYIQREMGCGVVVPSTSYSGGGALPEGGGYLPAAAVGSACSPDLPRPLAAPAGGGQCC